MTGGGGASWRRLDVDIVQIRQRGGRHHCRSLDHPRPLTLQPGMSVKVVAPERRSGGVAGREVIGKGRVSTNDIGMSELSGNNIYPSQTLRVKTSDSVHK